MSKSILIVNGHPDTSEERFCQALAGAYEKAATDAGHNVARIDVGALDFPFLRSRAEFGDGNPVPDIAAAQGAFKAAEHVVVIYPLWLGSMPALLKSFFEQCFRPGYAFEPSTRTIPKGYLKGRSCRVVVTMGIPAIAYRLFFLNHSIAAFRRNLLNFVGIRPVRTTIFGMIETGGPARHEKMLKTMSDLGKRAG